MSADEIKSLEDRLRDVVLEDSAAVREQEAEAIQQRAAQWASTGIKVSGRAVVGDVVGRYEWEWTPYEVTATGRFAIVRGVATDVGREVNLNNVGWTFGAKLQAPPNAPHSVKKAERKG